MTGFRFGSAAIMSAAATFLLLLPAADGGCGDVVIGGDGPSPDPTACLVTGCSGQLCSDEPVASTCEWTDAYACYDKFGICERDSEGACGWRETDELSSCIDDPPGSEPEPCLVTGCSGQLCADEPVASTCEWIDEYGCYQDHGVCARNEQNECAWQATDDLTGCIDALREAVSGACIKNSEDSCESDADCTSGGCGGELCYNPEVSGGESDCECTMPTAVSCGCVASQCTWWQSKPTQ